MLERLTLGHESQEALVMTFQERLRSIEERYDLGEREHAQEYGRTVAHLQD